MDEEKISKIEKEMSSLSLATVQKLVFVVQWS